MIAVLQGTGATMLKAFACVETKQVWDNQGTVEGADDGLKQMFKLFTNKVQQM